MCASDRQTDRQTVATSQSAGHDVCCVSASDNEPKHNYYTTLTKAEIFPFNQANRLPVGFCASSATAAAAACKFDAHDPASTKFQLSQQRAFGRFTDKMNMFEEAMNMF